MSDRHLDDLALATLAGEPAAAATDSRAHLDACPACRARLAEYRAFLAADAADVPAHDLADADARLAGLLAREVGGAAPATARATSLGARLARWWSVPALRPAFALAALAVVAGGVAVVSLTRGPLAPPLGDGDAVMRGEAAAAVALAAPERLPDGSIRLTWGATAGAEAYEVVLYSPLLDAVARERVDSLTTFTLPRERLMALAGGDTLLVRVRALRAGAGIGESRLEPLLPR